MCAAMTCPRCDSDSIFTLTSSPSNHIHHTRAVHTCRICRYTFTTMFDKLTKDVRSLAAGMVYLTDEGKWLSKLTGEEFEDREEAIDAQIKWLLNES